MTTRALSGRCPVFRELSGPDGVRQEHGRHVLGDIDADVEKKRRNDRGEFTIGKELNSKLKA